MSEYSQSYHVRALSRDALVERCRAVGLSGLAFEQGGGWLTFIPYENSEGYRGHGEEFGCFGSRLSKLVDGLVLEYWYAEDHLWGFVICDAGRLVAQYICSWDPEFMVERNVGADALRLIAAEGAIDQIEMILGARSHEQVTNEKLPTRFAHLIGLMHFEWLSPHYAQIDAQSLVERGAVRIGDAPVERVATAPQPPISRIHLPRTDPSARIVFDAAVPLVKKWDQTFYAARLSSTGNLSERGIRGPMILPNGRAAAHGGWSISFESPPKNMVVHVAVLADGTAKISSRQDVVRQIVDGQRYIPPPLGEQWLDSTDVLGIFGARHDIREQMGLPLYDAVLRLDRRVKADPEWFMTFMYISGKARIDRYCRVNAKTGTIVEDEVMDRK